MYPALKNDELIKLYLPDYPDGHIPDQEFFHKLVSSLYPVVFYELIISAYRSRSVYQSRGDGELVEICQEMEQEIKEVMMLPSKNYYSIFIYNSKTWKSSPSSQDKIKKGKEKS